MNPLETHLKTIVVSLITASIVFSATYFFDDKGAKAVLSTQLTQLASAVSELRGEVRAMQATFVTKDSYIDHEARLRALERRVLK